MLKVHGLTSEASRFSGVDLLLCIGQSSTQATTERQQRSSCVFDQFFGTDAICVCFAGMRSSDTWRNGAAEEPDVLLSALLHSGKTLSLVTSPLHFTSFLFCSPLRFLGEFAKEQLFCSSVGQNAHRKTDSPSGGISIKCTIDFAFQLIAEGITAANHLPPSNPVLHRAAPPTSSDSMPAGFASVIRRLRGRTALHLLVFSKLGGKVSIIKLVLTLAQN